MKQGAMDFITQVPGSRFTDPKKVRDIFEAAHDALDEWFAAPDSPRHPQFETLADLVGYRLDEFSTNPEWNGE